jgi:hypothetical protein
MARCACKNYWGAWPADDIGLRPRGSLPFSSAATGRATRSKRCSDAEGELIDVKVVTHDEILAGQAKQLGRLILPDDDDFIPPDSIQFF